MHLKRKRTSANGVDTTADHQTASNASDQIPQNTDERDFKRRKAYSHESWVYPAAFWDNLSSIPLTRNSLRELNIRNPAKPRSRSSVAAQRNAIISFKKEELPQIPPRFARHGGPNLTDIRGYPDPSAVMPAETSAETNQANQQSIDPSTTPNTATPTKTTTTRSGRPYDRAFRQHLVDNHIFPPAYCYPDGRLPPKPNNWDEIQERLARPRPSLSPSRFGDEEYERFFRAQGNATKERHISETVLSLIEGSIPDSMARGGGVQFANLKPLTDGTICPGNPDVYYGARPEQINLGVRKAIGDLITPTTQRDEPAAPSFMLAAKGPEGSLGVAERQSTYDGALGARGIHALRRYPFDDKEVYNGNAYCISSTYLGGMLTTYTSHLVTRSASNSHPDFVMTQIGSWSLRGNLKALRDGVQAYRNMRDWAKEQRDDAIKIANGETDCSPPTELTPTASSSQESFVDPRTRQSSKEEDKITTTLTDTVQSFAVQQDVNGLTKDKAKANEPQTLKHPVSPLRLGNPKRKKTVKN